MLRHRLSHFVVLIFFRKNDVSEHHSNRAQYGPQNSWKLDMDDKCTHRFLGNGSLHKDALFLVAQSICTKKSMQVIMMNGPIDDIMRSSSLRIFIVQRIKKKTYHERIFLITSRGIPGKTTCYNPLVQEAHGKCAIPTSRHPL